MPKHFTRAMAPVDQYLMADRNEEIALARSAAPESVARDATVMVLGRHGYETAIQGKNGFVCFVERSWRPVPEPTVKGCSHSTTGGSKCRRRGC